MKYRIREHDSDCEETVEASSLEEAIEMAQDWLSECEYAEHPEDYYEVTITDEDGDETVAEVVVGGPAEPPCVSGKEHEWESPYEVVGGIQENPGVWFHHQAGQLRMEEVCCHCGRYRQTITKSLDGQYPRTPERMTYRDANEKSRTWAGLANPEPEE
jgi:hypothetical protein